MKNGLRMFSLTALLGFGLLATSVAGGSEFSKFLHAAFDDQMGRPPSGTELNYHANLVREQGPLESYILMYGSDDNCEPYKQESGRAVGQASNL